MPTSPIRQTESARREYEIEGAQFLRSVNGMRITRPWEKKSGYALLLWVAVWLGMIGFLTGLGGHRDVEFTAWATLPGVFMAYAAMTRFFNSTVIDLTPECIRVRHTPLPWALGLRVATRDVTALRVRVKRVYYRGGPVDECRILFERTNGKQAMLVRGLEMSALEMSGIAATMSDYLGVPVHAD
jgi:hypothetical protein